MAAAATLPHDNLLPRPPGGLGPGAVLALLAHAGLLLALTQATDWRMQPPEVVSAELWAAVPQAAAPQPEAASPPVPGALVCSVTGLFCTFHALQSSAVVMGMTL